jgi:hypothetical protein
MQLFLVFWYVLLTDPIPRPIPHSFQWRIQGMIGGAGATTPITDDILLVTGGWVECAIILSNVSMHNVGLESREYFWTRKHIELILVICP